MISMSYFYLEYMGIDYEYDKIPPWWAVVDVHNITLTLIQLAKVTLTTINTAKIELHFNPSVVQ